MKQREGYLMMDHRASPGIPEAMARAAGLPSQHVGEGRLLEMATLKCCHCGGVFLKNPERTRERGSCAKCAKYLCDDCAAATHHPEYVHRSFQEIADMVRSGRFTIAGNPSAPTLNPV
jgi:hypothetical protein